MNEFKTKFKKTLLINDRLVRLRSLNYRILFSNYYTLVSTKQQITSIKLFSEINDSGNYRSKTHHISNFTQVFNKTLFKLLQLQPMNDLTLRKK